MRFLLISLLCTPLLAIPFTIPTAVHKATSADISGDYVLVEDSTTESVCPASITHTSWREFNSLPIVQHNYMLVDGVRCASTDAENGGKMTTFYNSFDYTFDYKPVSTLSPVLPELFTQVLTADGANMAAWTAGRNYGEDQGDDFLFGYDDRLRICGDQTIFPARTTTFLFRPFFGPLVVNNLETPLKSGYKWMIIVPTFKGGSCLYRSALPIEENEEDMAESMEPSPEDLGKEMGMESETEMDMEMHESMEPSPEEAESEEAACFPSEATVEMKSGEKKRMDELTVGDEVSVGDGKFAKVFGFTHRDSGAVSEFVRLRTATGEALTVSPGHLVYADGVVVEAKEVQAGARMQVRAGEGVVTVVTRVVKKGLFNPQTLGGEIAVDGFKVTTFTKAVNAGAGEALLAPVRALFRIGFEGAQMEKGAEWIRPLL
eukprot:GFKZ01007592.1.p1 GENE.GFKZ01007592.1~~GFKZ01007592.1.p1  ORF type:complete len:432 (-),score=71.52 GFKZ01007592.1:95-1390(-)